MSELNCYHCKKSIKLEHKHCPKCNAILVLIRSYEYHIREKIGHGGFGHVYKAERKIVSNYSNYCAIKEIDIQDQSAEMVEKEVGILIEQSSRLGGFIPDIYDYWQLDSKYYIAMQYIEGETINNLKWNPAKVEEFLQIMLKNLQPLHAAGIVHRDITPKNIKYDPHRGYVLLDFGLASLKDQSSLHGGTPGYRPIEQYRDTGLPEMHTDARSDLYSLAATAYFLLTHQRPLSALDRRAGQALRPIHTIEGMPKHLANVLLRMLAIYPDDRPQSAAQALAMLQTGEELPDVPEGSPPPEPTVVESISVGPTNAAAPYHWESMVPRRGRLRDIAWSPDEHYLAAASSSGLSIYNRATSSELVFVEMREQAQQVFYVDNETLLVVTPGEIKRYHQQLQQWQAPLRRMSAGSSEYSVAVAPDSQRVVIATHREIEIVSLDSHQELLELDLPVEAMAFSGDGMALALSDSMALTLHLLSRQAQTPVVLPISGGCSCLSLCHDGSRVAAVLEDSVEVWSNTAQRIWSYTPRDTVHSAVLSPDGEQVAIAEGHTVTVYSIANSNSFCVLDGVRLEALCFSPNGTYLAGASQERQWAWSVRDGTLLFERHDHMADVRSVSFSPDGVLLAAVGGDARVWRLEPEQLATPARCFANQTHQQNGLAFSHDGSLLAVGSRDGIRVWNTDSGTEYTHIPATIDQARGVAFAANGELWSASSRTIERRSLQADAIPQALLPDGIPILGAVFAGNGLAFAVYTSSYIHLWLTDRAEPITIESESAVKSVALSYTANYIAAICDNGAWIWEVQEKPVLKTRLQQQANRAVISPEGTYIALLIDHTIQLWDVDQKASRAIFEGHTDRVNDAAFAPRQQLLASCSQDGTVRLWKWE